MSFYYPPPPSPSMTATKYMKYGSASNEPFVPGQRYRNRRDMEMAVRRKNIVQLSASVSNDRGVNVINDHDGDQVYYVRTGLKPALCARAEIQK
jgi:hypothetical protein